MASWLLVEWRTAPCQAPLQLQEYIWLLPTHFLLLQHLKGQPPPLMGGASAMAWPPPAPRFAYWHFENSAAGALTPACHWTIDITVTSTLWTTRGNRVQSHRTASRFTTCVQVTPFSLNSIPEGLYQLLHWFYPLPFPFPFSFIGDDLPPINHCSLMQMFLHTRVVFLYSLPTP